MKNEEIKIGGLTSHERAVYDHCETQMIRHLEYEYDVGVMKAFSLLISFELTHGKKAVIDLFAFIMWMDVNESNEEKKMMMVKSTIGHDLNGHNDKFMLPRSDGYGVELWGEGYTNF